MKLFMPILLTPIINRAISTFRIRQLYLAYSEVNPCTLPDTNGFVACLQIFNKGKDKENKVEVTLPNTTTCHILSSNYPGATTKDNSILIDRVIPKQEISLIVYFDSKVGLSSAIKPFIKSDDTNGKVFSDKRNVPPSLGPAVMGASFVAAVTITFLYTLLSGMNILYPYHAYRYSKLFEQGIEPMPFSDNELVSHAGFLESPPIKVGPPILNAASITLPVTIRNITNKKIKAQIMENLDNKKYKEETNRASQDFADLSERVAAWRAIGKKYGYSPTDETFISDIFINPNEEKTVNISRTPTPATTINNFNLRIQIEKGNYDDPSFHDRYSFDALKNPEANIIQEQIRKIQNPTIK